MTQAVVQPIKNINCLNNTTDGIGIGQFNPEWIVEHNIKTIVESTTRIMHPKLPTSWDVTEYNNMGYPIESYASSRHPKIKGKGKPEYGKEILAARDFTYEEKDSFLIQYKKMALYGKYKEESDSSMWIVMDNIINISKAKIFHGGKEKDSRYYRYDNFNRLQEVKFGNGELVAKYEYPKKNQIKYSKVYSGLESKDKFLYTLDDKGNLIESYNLENGNTNTFEYNSDGSLHKNNFYWGPVLSYYVTYEYYNN